MDQLPVEMLMKVFRYLPSYNEVSLVNKQFYTIACEVNSTICLIINMRTFREYFGMDSNFMKTSNKKVSKVVLSALSHRTDRFTNVELRQVSPIIETFSATITILKLLRITVDEYTFLQILSLTPNLEHLDVLTVNEREDYSAQRQRSNNDLNLKKLKSLKIKFSDKLVQVFIRLPVGILTELHIRSYCEWNTVNSVLNRQFNIKKLKLERFCGDDVVADVFDKMNLESLELCYVMGRSNVAAVLSKQTQLKSFSLCGRVEIDKQDLNTIINQLVLEKLAIRLGHIPLDTFVKLRKLKKLKELTLLFRDFDGEHETTKKIQSLAEWNNNSLSKLTLDINSFITAEVIDELARSETQLKHLILKSRTPDSMAQDAIMRCFVFVHVLEIEIWGEPVRHSNYLNPDLRELSILVGVQFYKSWLKKFIASYPNLRRLKIDLVLKNVEDVATLNIRPILDWLTKLEYLIITASHLTIQDLEYLGGNKGSLKFVSLENLKDMTITDDLEKRLRSDFGLLSFDTQKISLRMAVDRHTWYEENSEFSI